MSNGQTLGRTVGFLGAGKMATALIKGVLNAGLFKPEEITASDVFEHQLNQLQSETGVVVTRSNPEMVDEADVVVLSVKPDGVVAALNEVKAHWKPDQLLISICAGVTLSKLESLLPSGARVVRVMPNTPCLVGASATGFAKGTHATEADGELVGKIFSAVGLAFQLPEKLLDAVTGLSGSGPAYVYLIIEALSDGGVACGLPRDVATKLAAQTVLGSAQMVVETGLHPAILREQVTSPGGTTIEGLYALEKGGVRGAMMNAVRAATEKSQLLGQKS